MSNRMKLPGPHEPKKPSPSHARAAMARKFRTYLSKAHAAAELAESYINDGALLMGAQYLREAADLLQQAHDTRERAIT